MYVYVFLHICYIEYNFYWELFLTEKVKKTKSLHLVSWCHISFLKKIIKILLSPFLVFKINYVIIGHTEIVTLGISDANLIIHIIQLHQQFIKDFWVSAHWVVLFSLALSIVSSSLFLYMFNELCSWKNTFEIKQVSSLNPVCDSFMVFVVVVVVLLFRFCFVQF